MIAMIRFLLSRKAIASDWCRRYNSTHIAGVANAMRC